MPKICDGYECFVGLTVDDCAARQACDEAVSNDNEKQYQVHVRRSASWDDKVCDAVSAQSHLPSLEVKISRTRGAFCHRGTLSPAVNARRTL